jgi:hypothetical protein
MSDIEQYLIGDIAYSDRHHDSGTGCQYRFAVLRKWFCGDYYGTITHGFSSPLASRSADITN